MTNLPDHIGNPQVCAGLPHPIVSVAVHYCPHRQAWTVSLTGGQAEGPVFLRTWSLGPFDTRDDALHLAIRELGHAIRVIPI